MLLVSFFGFIFFRQYQSEKTHPISPADRLSDHWNKNSYWTWTLPNWSFCFCFNVVLFFFALPCHVPEMVLLTRDRISFGGLFACLTIIFLFLVNDLLCTPPFFPPAQQCLHMAWSKFLFIFLLFKFFFKGAATMHALVQTSRSLTTWLHVITPGRFVASSFFFSASFFTKIYYFYSCLLLAAELK